MRCPYCNLSIDNHPPTECMNAWIWRLLGKTHVELDDSGFPFVNDPGNSGKIMAPDFCGCRQDIAFMTPLVQRLPGEFRLERSCGQWIASSEDVYEFGETLREALCRLFVRFHGEEV